MFVIYLLFLHFLADFVCQSNWMAINKSKSDFALSVHVITYTSVLAFGLLLVSFTNNMSIYLMFNAFCHFITDFFTSRLNSKLWAKENKHWFFVGIGFDQFIHAATLISSAILLGII